MSTANRPRPEELAQAELTVVSGVLNDPTGARFARAGNLPPSAFADPDHAAIWAGLVAGISVEKDTWPLDLAQKTGLPIGRVFDIAAADRIGAFFDANLAILQRNHSRRQRSSLAAQIEEAEDEQLPRLLAEFEAMAAGDFAGNGDPFAADLRRRQFDPSKPVPEVRPVFTIGREIVCTPGNLTTINAQAKAGKSAVVGAFLAATMTGPDSRADCLGISGQNSSGRAVLHFDTEQSVADYSALLHRARERSLCTDFPPWLVSYHLTGLTAGECRAAVEFALANAARRFKGVHSVFIDGVADLVIDPNDQAECFPLITRLHALAIKHDCPIVCVVHQNPAVEKTRGHLGSQLERKAESNLTLAKEDDGTITLFATKQRRGQISKDCGPRFCWSHDDGMHRTVESRQQEADKHERESLQALADDVFSGRAAMRYGEVIQVIKTTAMCSDRTAESRFTQLKRAAIIERFPPNLWAKCV